MVLRMTVQIYQAAFCFVAVRGQLILLDFHRVFPPLNSLILLTEHFIDFCTCPALTYVHAEDSLGKLERLYVYFKRNPKSISSTLTRLRLEKMGPPVPYAVFLRLQKQGIDKRRYCRCAEGCTHIGGRYYRSSHH